MSHFIAGVFATFIVLCILTMRYPNFWSFLKAK